MRWSLRVAACVDVMCEPIDWREEVAGHQLMVIANLVTFAVSGYGASGLGRG